MSTAGKIAGMVALVALRGVTLAAGKIARVSARILGEDEDVQWMQPYGFQSRPKPGAQAVAVAAGGTASGYVVVAVGDARYTLELDEGEVCIADDLGQKVHLTRSQGVIVDASLIKLGASATLGAARAGHLVDGTPAMTAWMAAVTSVVNGLVGGAPVIVDGTGGNIGIIAEGSSVVRIEG